MVSCDLFSCFPCKKGCERITPAIDAIGICGLPLAWDHSKSVLSIWFNSVGFNVDLIGPDKNYTVKDDFERIVQSVTVGFVALVAQWRFKPKIAACTVISCFFRRIAFFSILNPALSSLHSFLLLLLLSPLVSPRSLFREVTAFLGDGIIFILFLVQRKSVVRREEGRNGQKKAKRGNAFGGASGRQWAKVKVKSQPDFSMLFPSFENMWTRESCWGFDVLNCFDDFGLNINYWMIRHDIYIYSHIRTQECALCLELSAFKPGCRCWFCCRNASWKDADFLADLYFLHHCLQYLHLALPGQRQTGAVDFSGSGGSVACRCTNFLHCTHLGFFCCLKSVSQPIHDVKRLKLKISVGDMATMVGTWWYMGTLHTFWVWSFDCETRAGGCW